MRKSVLWNLPHVRLSLALVFALMGSLAISGCGGGGSSNPNPTPKPTNTGDPTKAAITGTVVDTTTAAAPVVGAVITVAGTNLSAKTDASGKFSIINAPVGSVGLIVTVPDATVYYTILVYNSKIYNDTSQCPLSVSTQASSKGTSPAGTIRLYPANLPPPPPPPAGCPQ